MRLEATALAIGTKGHRKKNFHIGRVADLRRAGQEVNGGRRADIRYARTSVRNSQEVGNAR